MGSLHRFAIDYTRHLRPRWQGFNFFFNHFVSASFILIWIIHSARFDSNQIALFIAHIKNCYIFVCLMNTGGTAKSQLTRNSFRPQWQYIHSAVGQFSITKNLTVRVYRFSYHTRHSIQQCVAQFQRGCIFIGRLRLNGANNVPQTHTKKNSIWQTAKSRTRMHAHTHPSNGPDSLSFRKYLMK